MTLLPMWRCHKVVRAIKIATMHAKVEKGMPVVLTPEDTSYSPIEVSQEWCRKRDVKEGEPGYYVVYDNGYTSWSPVETFESGYTRIGEEV